MTVEQDPIRTLRRWRWLYLGLGLVLIAAGAYFGGFATPAIGAGVASIALGIYFWRAEKPMRERVAAGALSAYNPQRIAKLERSVRRLHKVSRFLRVWSVVAFGYALIAAIILKEPVATAMVGAVGVFGLYVGVRFAPSLERRFLDAIARMREESNG